jgi:hypothetical protein
MNRGARDIDILIRATPSQVRAIFPHAVEIAENGLAWGVFELWCAPLTFLPNVRLAFDEALAARRAWLARIGWVLSPEDQLVLKLILQRTSEQKNDLEDARDILVHWSTRLDGRYIAWRAARCGASDRVRAGLTELAA